ncbi:hypothetical protein NIES2104_59040 [Leptolyngbya sp. NIES-2104]|nr:hypothetical protein NIES2104_59040 [Leptolyngbya sp. NIES-2104]
MFHTPHSHFVCVRLPISAALNRLIDAPIPPCPRTAGFLGDFR